MTKNRTPTPVYLDPGMHPGLEVKGLMKFSVPHHYIFFIIILPLYPVIFKTKLYDDYYISVNSTHQLPPPPPPPEKPHKTYTRSRVQ